MTVRLLFFARSREEAGAERADIGLPDGATVGDLRRELAARFGDRVAAYGLAVNESWSGDGTPLMEGDEVAVLPPISGGSFAALTTEKIDAERVVPLVAGDGMGAVVVFLGTVRDSFEGRPSAAVHYEGYRTMAEKELAHIAAAAEGVGDGVKVAVLHRLGTLQVGEVSVAIAAGAPHRAEAFDACRQVIERIKTSVPIWKKEIAPGGAESWHDEPPQGTKVKG